MPGVTQYAVDALANVARTTVVVPLRAPTNLQLNSRAFPNPTPSTVTLVPPLTCPRRGAMPEIAILAAFAPSFARRCCRCTDALVNRARVAFDASARAATAMSASKATNAMRLAFARHLARRARRGGDGMGVDGPRRAPCSDATRRGDVVWRRRRIVGGDARRREGCCEYVRCVRAVRRAKAVEERRERGATRRDWFGYGTTTLRYHGYDYYDY